MRTWRAEPKNSNTHLERYGLRLEPEDRSGVGKLMVDLAAKGTPEHWRQCAQKTRADAERRADSETKMALLDIAALYDRLADIAEKRAIS